MFCRSAVCTGMQQVAYYEPEVLNAEDYYVFGGTMEGPKEVGGNGQKNHGVLVLFLARRQANAYDSFYC